MNNIKEIKIKPFNNSNGNWYKLYVNDKLKILGDGTVNLFTFKEVIQEIKKLKKEK